MRPDTRGHCQAIVVGGSAGATGVVIDLVEALPADFRIPTIVCLHLHPTDGGQVARHLAERSKVPVAEAYDKMPVLPGRVLVAPADYHLLVERSRTLALSTEPKVHYCRPSIDVLFESAASAYAAGLLGILLSGANEDGAAGMSGIRRYGGVTIAQDPATAHCFVMPRAAIDCGAASLILSPDDIRRFVLLLYRYPGLEAAARELGAVRP